MDLGNPKNTIEVIQKYNFAFQKKFGQNFLIDTHVQVKIISAAGMTKEDTVLEGGPGIGTMTQRLSQAAGQVIAVEIDTNLIPILKDTLQDCENVTVINEDILKIDIKKMAEEKPQDKKNPPAAADVTESTPAAAEQGKEGNKDPPCTLSVRCDSILNHMDWLDKEKVELVPPDGVIYAEREVSFHEGESVFDVLLREMKNNQIHMEFENTPLYKSAYIEGIANLYEFDCGELSGWMYRVNGVFPNFGCSKYILKDGDKIEWLYTCDLGADIGGGTF